MAAGRSPGRPLLGNCGKQTNWPLRLVPASLWDGVTGGGPWGPLGLPCGSWLAGRAGSVGVARCQRTGTPCGRLLFRYARTKDQGPRTKDQVPNTKDQVPRTKAKDGPARLLRRAVRG